MRSDMQYFRRLGHVGKYLFLGLLTKIDIALFVPGIYAISNDPPFFFGAGKRCKI